MANRYWIGGAGNWSDTAHWSASSGGAGGASVPDGQIRHPSDGGDVATNDVFFDANSFSSDGDVVTLDVDALPKSLDMSGVAYLFSFAGTGKVITQGTVFKLSDKFTASNTGLWSIIPQSSSTVSVDQNGANMSSVTEFTLTGGRQNFGGNNFSLASNLNFPSADFTIQADFFTSANTVFSSNNHSITCATFSELGLALSTLSVSSITVNFGTTTLNTGGFIAGGSTLVGYSVTFNGSTSIINFTPTGDATNVTTADNNISIYHSGVSGTVSLGSIIIYKGTGSTTFSTNGGPSFDLSGSMSIETGSTVHFGNGAAYNISGTFFANGNLGDLIILDKSVLSGNHITGPVILNAAVSNTSYVQVSDSAAGGVGIPFLNIGGTDGGGNTNWVFVPIADFTATPTSGFHPLAVSFTDTSTQGPTSWLWDFKNDGTQTSTEQNPSHIYSFDGIYTVKLTVTNSLGSDIKIRTEYIEVTSDPHNQFLQNVFLVGADTAGTVQMLNVGKSDDGTPIYYELETQELEFGNRSHLKQISDQIAVYTQFGLDSILQVRTNEGEYQDVPMSLDARVNIGEDIDIEGYFFTFKWFGVVKEASPVFEGIEIESITDRGMTKP